MWIKCDFFNSHRFFWNLNLSKRQKKQNAVNIAFQIFNIHKYEGINFGIPGVTTITAARKLSSACRVLTLSTLQDLNILLGNVA